MKQLLMRPFSLVVIAILAAASTTLAAISNVGKAEVAASLLLLLSLLLLIGLGYLLWERHPRPAPLKSFLQVQVNLLFGPGVIIKGFYRGPIGKMPSYFGGFTTLGKLYHRQSLLNHLLGDSSLKLSAVPPASTCVFVLGVPSKGDPAYIAVIFGDSPLPTTEAPDCVNNLVQMRAAKSHLGYQGVPQHYVNVC